MQSVERLTLIELFSTFFDRMCTNHPQRDTMIRDLFQFKSILYSNDQQAVDNFLTNVLKSRQEKSPIREIQARREYRETKENRENSSQRVNGTSRVTRINSKKVTTTTSCGHEVEREVLLNHINRQKENFAVECPVCLQSLSNLDYSSVGLVNPFEELKQRHQPLIRSVQQIQKNDDYVCQLLSSLETDEHQTQKNRQMSTVHEFGRITQQTPNPASNNGNSRIVSQESEFGTRIKKCLRCSKQVDGQGYFCQACKNFS